MPGWTALTVPGDTTAQDATLADLAPVERDLVVLRDRERLRLFGRGATGPKVAEFATARAADCAHADALPMPDDLPATGPAALTLVEDFLAEAGPLVAAAVAAVHAGECQRTDIGFDTMVAHLVAVSRYLPRDDSAIGALVLRSHPVPIAFPSVSAHADGLIALGGGKPGLRGKLRRQYNASSAAVERRLRALLAQLQDGGPLVSEHAQRWHDLVDRYRACAEDAVIRGDLAMVEHGDEALPDPGIGSMHALTAAAPALREYLGTDTGYLSMRFMMGLLYLTLHAGLGLGMTERLVLCNAIARSMEAVLRRGVGELMAHLVTAITTDSGR